MGWLEDAWDTLTGQKQETQRTRETNAANERAVKDTNALNRAIASDTNATNKQIADENLAFQRENLEYQKELQKQIFEREDTAYQRTKQDMLNAGLNPLSMQGTNGAGEAIATQPMNNNFQSQIGAPMQAPQYIKPETKDPLSPLRYINEVIGSTTGLAGTINNIATGTLQRDQIQLANERQRLENLVYAKQHDIDINSGTVQNPYGWDENQKREYEHKVDTKKYDSDTEAEKLVTAGLDALNGRYDEAVNNTMEKIKENPIVNAAIKQYSSQQKTKNINNVLSEARKKYGFTLLNRPKRTKNDNGTETITLKNMKQTLTIVVDTNGNKIAEYIKPNTKTSNYSGKF